MEKQDQTDRDQRLDHLDGWFAEKTETLDRSRSVSATLSVRGVGLVRLEDFERAVSTAYSELLRAIPDHPDYGIDRQEGIPTARAVRGLANSRMRSRLLDLSRREQRGTNDMLDGRRSRMISLEAPKEDSEPSIVWSETIEDRRADVGTQVEARELIRAIADKGPIAGGVLLAPAIGIDDARLVDQFDLTHEALRQRRSRGRKALRTRLETTE